ncbi:MAG TPA: protein-methionine-sulfoxide reductase catalytic subunit MsrP [Terriglobia bacterium]|nr:protein-methionine-sulfoxide reductase catalytic subunit MsrP [Terriglobia bacterium]
MLIKKPSDILSSEITSEYVYRNRRQFLQSAAATLAAAGMASLIPTPGMASSKYDTDEMLTPEKDVTSYNNYYEFGTDKDEPVLNAKGFKLRPWTVNVTGMVKKPATYHLDDLLKGITMEDRIYRMRCVERWSMVIPWRGLPLATLIKKLEPLPSARFIKFQTLLDPERMPEQRRQILHWPYTEGLRMDEANNELTLLAIGVYGKEGPAQNGAPLRLITPWKYGFKGVKAIVKIEFTDKMPLTAWAEQAPHEYGFYANVNPSVDHPRWSQATEARLTGGLFDQLRPIKTRIFNGYGQYVEKMYAGLDLRVNY